jgi:hypothetical protein
MSLGNRVGAFGGVGGGAGALTGGGGRSGIGSGPGVTSLAAMKGGRRGTAGAARASTLPISARWIAVDASQGSPRHSRPGNARSTRPPSAR